MTGPKEMISQPPVALLYQPFGYFDDICDGVKVPGEEHIDDGDLQQKVNALADAMSGFYKTEEKQRSKFIEYMEHIFSIPPGSMYPSKIPSTQNVSDGHVNGDHGAMVFCMERKNELSLTSCEPVVQLVSYIASSFRS